MVRTVVGRLAAALIVSSALGSTTASAAPVPVLKRSTNADRPGYVLAHGKQVNGVWDGWMGGQVNAAQSWYRDRYQSLVVDIGEDWPTSWAPRNWHADAWAYRKGTSYLKSLGLHTAPGTSQFFVTLTNPDPPILPNGQPNPNPPTGPAAINYECGASGCTQALLNLTRADARDFWLYGEDWATKGVVPATTDACHEKWAHTYGVLDLLACKNGPGGSNGNIKGLWLDDVLGDLATVASPADASSVAWLNSGLPVANGKLWQALPFTQTQWTDGMVKLLTDLRSGISTLKSQGRLAATQGKVAINYKWQSFGYSTRPLTGPYPGLTIDPIGARLIQAADYVELENGWVDGVRVDDDGKVLSNGLTAGGLETQWSFERRRLFVKQVHDLGRSVIEEKTNSADMLEYRSASCLGDFSAQDAPRNAAHYATAQYNLAATLVNWTPGDMVGDICELYGQSTATSPEYGRGWDGYQSDLGTPVAITPTPPTPAGWAPLLPGTSVTNGIIERRFTNGRVLVAPPGVEGEVDVPLDTTLYARIDGQELRPVTTVRLKRRQGVVLLNSNCSTTACPAATVSKTWKLTGKLKLPTILRDEANVTGTLTTTRTGNVVTTTYAINDVTARGLTNSTTAITFKLGLIPSGSSYLLGYSPVFQGTPQKFRVKVKEAKYFGAVPIELGNSCQTKSLSDLAWTGNVPLGGGAIESTFSISDVNGCTGLNGVFSSATASTANSLKLTVTPNP